MSFLTYCKADELRYVYQRIGFQCLSETLFEDAGLALYNGELDPRLLLSYFPDLRGNLFSPEDVIDVFAGVADRMPTDHSVDEISKYSTASLVYIFFRRTLFPH